MAMANGIGAQAGRAQRSVSTTEAAKNAAQNTLDKATKFSQIKGILKAIPPTRENLKKVMALFLKPATGTTNQIRPDRATAIPDLKIFLDNAKSNTTSHFSPLRTMSQIEESDFSKIPNGDVFKQELIALLDLYSGSAAAASTAAGNGGGGAAIPAIPFAPAKIVGTEPGTTLPTATLVHTTPEAALEAPAPYNPATANPEAYMNNLAQEFVHTKNPSDRLVIVAEVIGNEELTDNQVLSFLEKLNLPPESDIMNDGIRPKWAESHRSKTAALMQTGGGGGGNQPVIDMWFHRYDVNGQRLERPSLR